MLRTISYVSMSLLLAGLSASASSPPVSAAAPDPTLKVGEVAPAIDVLAWVKGKPVRQFEPGHVYIVEFWATWCGPCIAAMPHLSEVQRTHAGKVTVIAVDVRENEKNKTKLVAGIDTFVKGKGQKMEFTVAVDDPEKQSMFRIWLTAAGYSGLPTSFIVDGKGRITWMGNPSTGGEKRLDTALREALDGNADLGEAQREQELINEDSRAQQQYNAESKTLDEAIERKNYPLMVAEVERLSVLIPQYRAMLFSYRALALLHIDEVKGMQTLQAEAADEKVLKGRLSMSPENYWNQIAAAIANEAGFSTDMYRFALGRLERQEAANGESYLHWMTVAMAYHHMGNAEQAVQAQRRAVDAARRSKDLPEGSIQENLENMLRRYESQLAETSSRQ